MGKAIIIHNIDYSKTGLGNVTLLLPLQTLSIIGDSSVIGTSRFNVEYVPSNTFETGVTWSIVDGNEYATIDENGTVTALEGADESSVTIRATSIVNPSIYAEKIISVSETYELLNVHKVFGGTVDDVIETDYKLLSSEMPNWTLLVNAPDALGAGTGANLKTALHCMDETGAPYYGITFHASGNNSIAGMGCDVNMDSTSANNVTLNRKTRAFVRNMNSGPRFATNEICPVGISRQGNELYYTTNGEAWIKFDYNVHEIENKLVIGAYRDSEGNLGRFYNSNGEYLDIILYPQSFVNSINFFREHGVKQSFYTINNYICDGTEETAINTEITPFDGTSYTDGILVQADITLPNISVVNEQTLFGCKNYTASTANGLKITNSGASSLTCNINPAISAFSISVTRGSNCVISVRFKDNDYAVTIGSDNNASKTSSSSVPNHSWPLTIGGALSELPNIWYSDRFAALTINSLTIREL